MGLEDVELIMELEDEFGIDIKDEDIANVRTVGALYDVVMAKLALPAAEGACLSGRVFYRLRRGLQEVGGLDRRRIRPGTPLTELIPAPGRRRTWDIWAIRSGIRLPQLDFPRRLRPLIHTLVCATALAIAGILPYAMHLGGAEISGVVTTWGVAVIVALVALYRVAARWAVAYPPHVETLGDLTHEVVRRGVPAHHQVDKDRALMTAETVWNRLVDIIEREHYVKRDLITPTADLYEDLKFG
jgi:hypothetical protein